MTNKQSTDVEQIEAEIIFQSVGFKQLIRAKKRFIIPIVLFFLVFYFTLPLLTAYSTVLNTPAVGSITWAWVFAFAQFIMTWTLCMWYLKKAAVFDRMAARVAEDAMQHISNKGDVK